MPLMRAESGTESGEKAAVRWTERFPLADVPWTASVTITVLFWLFSWWLRWALDAQLPPGFPFVTFFPVVILTSFLFGARIGTLSAVLCGLVAWHEFTPPMHSWYLNKGGYVAMGFYAFITATDIAIIHWMQRSNRRLKKEREANAQLARTRELLFRELQHRVSNNLQMVAGLLSLQRRQVTDPAAQAALDESARRMGVIGRISRQLYDPSGESRSMSAFLRELADDVVDASGRDGINVAVTVADDAPLPPDTAIPLALIVAEAVSNSIEHGFEGRPSGRIDISLSKPDERRVALVVEDDGAGLPDGFSLDGASSLGLKIATLLARQLGGAFSLEPRHDGGGAASRLDLPVAA
jgi:two-component sensor histidine kinase